MFKAHIKYLIMSLFSIILPLHLFLLLPLYPSRMLMICIGVLSVCKIVLPYGFGYCKNKVIGLEIWR